MNDKLMFPEQECSHFSPSVDKGNRYCGRMRFHQSWYRSIVLGLEPGTNPQADYKIYGNMLTVDDGLQGKNFLTPEIFETVQACFPINPNKQRSIRLYHNLLSSQPMCFNLLAPLKSHSMATSLFRSLPGFPQDATVMDIEFEYAPDKEDHLDDRTAFDAFITYERANGSKGFLGIETKLTEPFSQDKYEFEDRYARWMTRGEWWWKSGAESDFSNKEFNQLWRNHLLVYAILNQEAPEYQEGCCVVIYPVGDQECGAAIEKYRELLSPAGEESLLVWTLESIAEKWAPVLEGNPDLQEWFDLFLERYLRLERSEEEWQKVERSYYG